MSVLLKSEELAKDVAGAEALLQRHNEHKVVKLFIMDILSMRNFYLYLLQYRKISL